MATVKILHFSDILCIWAYVGEQSLHHLTDRFGAEVEIEPHFCSVFPDTHSKISRNWRDRGGFEGYGAHVHAVAGQFGVKPLHKGIWAQTRPRSSASPHLLVKAVELADQETGAPRAYPHSAAARVTAQLRHAFFRQARDVSNWAVHREICRACGISYDAVRNRIETGEAVARLSGDYDLAQTLHVQGSPTYIMNEGRQILFGNISYHILEANVHGLLSGRDDLAASRC